MKITLKVLSPELEELMNLKSGEYDADELLAETEAKLRF